MPKVSPGLTEKESVIDGGEGGVFFGEVLDLDAGGKGRPPGLGWDLWNGGTIAWEGLGFNRVWIGRMFGWILLLIKVVKVKREVSDDDGSADGISPCTPQANHVQITGDFWIVWAFILLSGLFFTLTIALVLTHPRGDAPPPPDARQTTVLFVVAAVEAVVGIGVIRLIGCLFCIYSGE